MKWEFTPDRLTQVVYELKAAEETMQHAKDNYEILWDSGKDLLAAFKLKTKCDTEGRSETLARASQEWKDYKAGLYEAQRELGKASIEFHHKERVYDSMINGMSFNKELIKKGILDT